jgi:hypothetical protein
MREEEFITHFYCPRTTDELAPVAAGSAHLRMLLHFSTSPLLHYSTRPVVHSPSLTGIHVRPVRRLAGCSSGEHEPHGGFGKPPWTEFSCEFEGTSPVL